MGGLLLLSVEKYGFPPDPKKYPVCPTCKDIHAEMGDVSGSD